MNYDAVLRTAAVAAAVALWLSPQWGAIAAAAVRLAQAARARSKATARVAAAGLVIGALWGKVPLPSLSVPVPAVVKVEKPSDAMRSVVEPVVVAMRDVPTGDRMLWASVWSKAAVVVAGDAVSTEVVFTDTRSLRAFTILALEIGWRRIGGNAPGEYAGLRQAVEAAFASVLGTAEVNVTKDTRERYAELCRAIAWAGLNAG